MTVKYEPHRGFAQLKDENDPLASLREEFLFPPSPQGGDSHYFAGNSLGLQPKKARQYINEELEDWARFGVEGHLLARKPWLPYHEFVTEPMARVVGALPTEVVVMNTLTVNLHLMMVSFYRPTAQRFKILIEASAFPSDQYAVASQAKFHGYDPREAIVEIKPRAGESLIRKEDLLELIDRDGSSIALVLLGNVNYLTGQAFPIAEVARAAHQKGCVFGVDLAHGAGNLLLQLHDWNVDFAVWCSYKYLNSGPGALAGCFVHEKHHRDEKLPRFSGWWGHDKKTRFTMPMQFSPIPTVESWQLSNPPIFQLAAIRASLELFDQARMDRLREKSVNLTGYLEHLLSALPADFCVQTTSRNPDERGAQLSYRFPRKPKELVHTLAQSGVIADFREPDVIRFAPAPLYCRYQDVYQLAEVLKSHATR